MSRPDVGAITPGLNSFLQSLKGVTTEEGAESAIASFTSLLKRRQIQHSRASATATIALLSKVILVTTWTDVPFLISRIQSIGTRLISAQPRELAVGNIVRRVLGLIRQEAEEDRTGAEPRSELATPMDSGIELALSGLKAVSLSTQPSAIPGSAPSTGPGGLSMFNLLSHPSFTPTSSNAGTPAVSRSASYIGGSAPAADSEIKADILSGLSEISDELSQASDQIAGYATDHIHSNEIILTSGASLTVQKFLLQAAKAKLRFTVVHAENYPNDAAAVHSLVTRQPRSNSQQSGTTEQYLRPLTSAGVTVILIPDSAVFAIMSRVNKVILGTSAVLANGGLVAGAGTRSVALAAKAHRVPVVVLSGVYKLSPVYPFDLEALVEWGDASKVLEYEDAEAVDKIEVLNPLIDYVDPSLVDLYITNIGGHAPSYLHRVMADHYRGEDIRV